MGGTIAVKRKTCGVMGGNGKRPLGSRGAMGETTGVMGDKGETTGVKRKTIGVKGGNGRDHWGDGGQWERPLGSRGGNGRDHWG